MLVSLGVDMERVFEKSSRAILVSFNRAQSSKKSRPVVSKKRKAKSSHRKYLQGNTQPKRIKQRYKNGTIIFTSRNLPIQNSPKSETNSGKDMKTHE